MARPKTNQTKSCTGTGLETSTNKYYRNQSHVKAVYNRRRNTGASKNQLTRMFNQLNAY